MCAGTGIDFHVLLPGNNLFPLHNFHNCIDVPNYTDKHYTHAITLRLPRNVAWARSLGKHVTILHDIVLCRWCDVLEAVDLGRRGP
jgi:hypothetical protein